MKKIFFILFFPFLLYAQDVDNERIKIKILKKFRQRHKTEDIVIIEKFKKSHIVVANFKSKEMSGDALELTGALKDSAARLGGDAVFITFNLGLHCGDDTSYSTSSIEGKIIRFKK